MTHPYREMTDDPRPFFWLAYRHSADEIAEALQVDREEPLRWARENDAPDWAEEQLRNRYEAERAAEERHGREVSLRWAQRAERRASAEATASNRKAGPDGV